MPALAYLMVDFHRCPVQYNARRGDLGVVVCQDAVAATTQRRAMRAWKGETDAAIGRTSIRVRNVIVYGGSAARMRALARELR